MASTWGGHNGWPRVVGVGLLLFFKMDVLSQLAVSPHKSLLILLILLFYTKQIKTYHSNPAFGDRRGPLASLKMWSDGFLLDE